MSGPEDYVNFADYLGLNNEAGQDMLNRTVQGNQPKGGLDDVRKLSQSQYDMAGDTSAGSDANYARVGDAARKGLAAYGDFMKGMNDPAYRQALMEKTYGRGAVSALDSAMAGTGGMDAQQQQFKDTERDVNRQGMDADIRRSGFKQNEKDFQEGQARDAARRQGVYDENQKNNAGYEKARADLKRQYPGKSAREIEMLIRSNARTGGLAWKGGSPNNYGTVVGTDSQVGKNGNINWDRYFGEEEKFAKGAYENRPRPDTWMRGFMPEWPGSPDSSGTGASDDANSWANTKKRKVG